MITTRVLIGLLEFVFAVSMSGVVIYLTYRVFIIANPDFDMEAEIRKGNTSVGLLVGAILFAASTMIQRGMDSVMSMVKLRLSAPAESGYSIEKLLLMCLGQLVMSMTLAILTVSITLRLFGLLARARGWRPGQELQKNNVAVGILLATVVIVASMYVGEGISALSKSLTPQPTIGRIQIMR
jgi:uncharacterized membrane protein YjfL (UPF0719 family)